MILSRTAENSGNGIYNIELEVVFSDGSQEASLKEIWTVENDRAMKVSIQGMKDLKGFYLNYLYAGGNRWTKNNQTKESSKISEDFIEKWQHFRNSDIFLNALLAYEFIPEGHYNKKDGKLKSINEDPFLKLSRSQGVIAYSIGDNKKTDTQHPRLWIEQDFFMIRKIRLASGVEVFMDNYKSFSKNLHFPKERVLKWSDHSVTIKTISVLTRTGNPGQLFSPQLLEANNHTEILNNHSLRSQIEEFYSRFR